MVRAYSDLKMTPDTDKLYNSIVTPVSKQPEWQKTKSIGETPYNVT